MPRLLLLAPVLAGCFGSASAKLQLANSTPAARTSVLADGTSLRLKIIAVYLAEDVDPVTMNNIGNDSMVWINPECGGDISACNVAGLVAPDGPRIASYFDLARPTAEVNAELNSQDADVSTGVYRFARIELCKALDGPTNPTVPTMMWAGPGMAGEQPFASTDCGRTSLPFDPPLTLAASDSVAVTLGYDLGKSIVAGPPDPSTPPMSHTVAGHTDPDGSLHWFRDCVDLDAQSRVCMEFPDFAPSATAVTAATP